MLRRLLLPVLTALVLAGAVVPASAAGRRCHGRHRARVTVSAEGAGSLIAITYRSGLSQRVRFVRSDAAIDRVTLTDIDNDGDLDILAAPRDGRLMLWRNGGDGRFALATLPQSRLTVRGARFVRVHPSDDGWQWGVERYDAAMPRAPAVAAVAPIALVRVSPFVPVRPLSLRRSSGRAPPLA